MSSQHSHPMHGQRAATTIAVRRALLSLSTAGTLALAACGPTDTLDAADSTAAVRAAATAIVLAPEDVAVATVDDVITGVTLTGSLEPAEKVTVTAQVGGTIGAMTVDRGSAVRPGQRLTTIQAAGVQSQVAGARAGVAAAEANLAVARTQRDAAKRLHEAGATSLVDYQNVEAAYAAAEAQLAAARAQSTAAGEAAGYTVVTAPIAGTVSARPAEPGQAIRAGDEILSIVNTSTLELAGRVPVDEVGAIRVGQPVTFTLDAFPGREFRGSVARKDPAADPSTRQVGVFVRLPNRDGEITAGQYARGLVSGRQVSDAVTVPLTAVQGTGAGAAVFVVAGDTLSRRTVTLGARDERTGRVVIQSGLEAGEMVLARPTATVSDGQRVTVSTDQRQSSPAASSAPSPAPAAADTTPES
ncbi:MAG: efflux RND transporter periplasmic adaptor subunit [Gemmatimonadaceae bacterium]